MSKNKTFSDIRLSETYDNHKPESENGQKDQKEKLIEELAYHQQKIREIKKQLQKENTQSIPNHYVSTINLDETPHAYIFLDKKGEIMETNDRFAQIINSSPDELKGKNITQYLIPESKETFKKINSAEAPPEYPEIVEIKLVNKEVTTPVRMVYSPNFSILFGKSALKQWIVFDISKEYEVKTKLETNENILARFMEYFPGMAFIKNHKGELVKANQVYASIIGRPLPEIIGKDDRYLMPEFFRKQIIIEDEQVLNENKVLQVEHTFKSDVNQINWLTVKFPIHLDKNNTFLGALSLNITDRKTAYEKLKKQNALFSSIERITSLGIAEIDIKSGMVSLSKNMQNILGVDQELISILEVYTLFHPDDKQMALKKYYEATNSGLPFDVYHRMLNKDNDATRHLHSAGEIISGENGEPTKISIFSMDISEYFYTTEALRKSEERYRQLVETSPEGIVVIQDGIFSFINQAGAKILGYSDPVQLTGKNILDFVHPDDYERLYRQVKTIGQKEYDNEKRIIKFLRKDGSITTIEAISVLINLNNKPALLIFGNDISEKIETRKELRKRENLLERVFEILPVGLWLTNEKGEIIVGNPAGRKIWGIESDKNLRNYNNAIIRRFSSGKFIVPDHQILKEMVQEGSSIENELLEIRALDGVARTILCHMAPVLDNEGNVDGALIINNDISELKIFEQKLNNKINELQTLFSISTIVRTETSKTKLLNDILKQTLTVIKAEAGIFWNFKKNSKRLQAETVIGLPDTFLKKSFALSNQALLANCLEKEMELSRQFQDSVSDDPDFSELLIIKGWGQSSSAILSSNEVFGIFQIFKSAKSAITQDEKKLLKSITEMTGSALHRLKLYDEVNYRLEYMQLMQKIDQAISTNTDLKITLNILLDQVTQHFNTAAVTVSVVDFTLTSLKTYITKGFNNPDTDNEKIQLGHGVLGKNLLANKIYIHDPSQNNNDQFERKNIMLYNRFSTLICLPIFVKGEIKGALEVYLRQDETENSSEFATDYEMIQNLKPIADQAGIAIENAHLFSNLQSTNLNLKTAYDSTIEGWSKALELRDEETKGHSSRVTQLTMYLAEKLGFTGKDLNDIRYGALLHDIGKMGIPDRILHKPGPLTEEEWEIMRRHPQFAYDLLSPIDYLHNSLDIPYCHHEKWDGSGYPRGLKGKEIPLAARIFSLADVWDALSSDRPYRSAWPTEKICIYMKEQRGIHFDPQILDLFLQEMEITNNFTIGFQV